MALKIKTQGTLYLNHKGREYNAEMLKDQAILAHLKEQGCEEVVEDDAGSPQVEQATEEKQKGLLKTVRASKKGASAERKSPGAAEDLNTVIKQDAEQGQ